jgi:hypothetical protein
MWLAKFEPEELDGVRNVLFLPTNIQRAFDGLQLSIVLEKIIDTKTFILREDIHIEGMGS